VKPEDREHCSSGCERPADPLAGHYVLALAWWLWELAAWPWTVRELKRAGFVRTGWRTWEVPGDE
jgi:hypothetical protein